MKVVVNKLVFIMLLTLWIGNGYVISVENNQNIQSKVKVALIYNFANNIEWTNEKQITEYSIGVLSSDTSMLNEFNILANKFKIKNKKIIVKRIDNTRNIVNCQILFFDKNYCNILPEVYPLITGKNTLIISDQCTDGLFTMINLLHDFTSQTISYEINRQNTESEGFNLKPDILIHGGSYIDIKDLYIKTYNQLRDESQKIREIQDLLEQIYTEKDSIQNQAKVLQSQVSNLKSSRERLEKDFLQVTDSLAKKDKLLVARIRDVRRYEAESHSLQNRISIQLSNLTEVTDSLKDLNEEIALKHTELEIKQKQIDEQTEALSEKETIIGIQRKLIYVSIALAFSLILGLYMTYRAYRIRREVNQKLELLVENRTNELHLSREHFKNLFENSPISICDMNVEDVYTFVKSLGVNTEEIKEELDKNPELIIQAINLIKVNDANSATLHLFDFGTKQDFINQYLSTYRFDKDYSFKNTLLALLQNQKKISYDGYRQTSKGELKHLQISWMVLPGYENNYRRLIVTMADITELTRHRNHLEELVSERTAKIVDLNKELTETVEELENTLQILKDTQTQLINSEKMASLGLLTAGLAHEINNPINYVSASKQALDPLIEQIFNYLKDIKLDTITQEKNIENAIGSIRFLLDNMDIGIKRTTEIISSLMTYSRTGDL